MTLKSAQLNLWRESIQASISNYFSFIIDILILILLNNYLSIEAVGSYFLILSIVYVMSDFFKGISTAIKKKVSEKPIGEKSSFYWAGIFILLLLLGLVAIGLVISHIIIIHYTGYDITQFDLLVLYILFFGICIKTLSIDYVSACGLPGKAEVYRMIFSKLGTLILIYVVFNLYHASYQGALIGYSIAHIISFVIIFIATPKIKLPNINTFKQIYDFAKWSIPNHLLNDIYHRYDTLLLGIMVGLASVSYYDTSVRVAAVGFGIAYGLSRSSIIIFSGRDTEGFPIKKLFDKTIGASSFIMIPSLIFFIIYGTEFLTMLFGTEYDGAYWFLIGISIQMIMQNYRLQFESLFGGINKPKITTVASFYTIGINIIIAPIFIIIMGGIGVVVSSVISEFLRIAIFQKYTYEKFGEYSIPKMALIQYPISIFVGIFAYIISAQFTNILIEFSVFIIIFMIAYNLILYKICKDYRQIIRSLLYNDI